MTAKMDESIIKIQNVSLSLDKTPILRGINLNVQRGTIFGLIGPSGCGKTTLIRAILGLLPYQAGSITVDSNAPSQVTKRQIIGYMPQELALPPIITPREMMEFCGKVYQIKKQDLAAIVNILFNGFNVTQPDTFIGLLNTGQKRRVSLCCALVNKPRLAILDEPTVGSDPLIRRNIWQYVKKCSLQDGMTVIITTHYFEEVMAADEIGFMREGRLMMNGEPNKILQHYQVDTLEEAMFEMCKKTSLSEDKHHQFKSTPKSNLDSIQVDNTISSDDHKLKSLDEMSSSQPKRLKPSGQPTISALIIMQAIFWRITRNLHWIYLVAAFACFAHFFHIYMLEEFFGRGPKNMPVCIISHEHRSDLMEIFLTKFDERFVNLTLCSDRDTAWSQVQHGLLAGFVEIPDHYLSSIEDLLVVRNDSHRDLSSIIDLQRIKFHGDYSNQLNAGIVEKVIGIGLLDYFEDRFAEHGLNPKYLSYVEIDPIFGSLKQDDEISRHHTFMPIVILWIIHFYSLGTMIFGLELENTERFIERQYSMGIQAWHIILAQIVYGMAIHFPVFCAFYYGFTLLIGLPLFNWYNLIFTIFMVISDLSGMCSGLLLFSPVGNMIGAVVLLCGYMMTGFWVSGLIRPFEALPYWVAQISYIFPFHWLCPIASKMMRGQHVPTETIIINSLFVIIVHIIVPLGLFTWIKKQNRLRI